MAVWQYLWSKAESEAKEINVGKTTRVGVEEDACYVFNGGRECKRMQH